MSNVIIDDQSSRLKHFIWEELDKHFFIAVIFRSDRRYFVQRHFEQQLFDIKSSLIQNKWRRCLSEIISNSLSPIYITFNEAKLMNEIVSWHLNYSNSIQLQENIDYIIDFEDLIDCFNSMTVNDINHNHNHNMKSFILQPVTTLDAARKNIEMWKDLQNNIIENNANQTIDNKRVKRRKTRASILNNHKSSFASDQFPSTGWIQLDSKIVPFIRKQCDRLLPVDYLLKEHIISSCEDFSLRSLYIPISYDDIEIFNDLIQQLTSSSTILTNYSSLITLDHLIFRLKRLFFIRFISSPKNIDYIDYNQIMSYNGGFLTLINNKNRRIPFIYIDRKIYIPQINNYINISCISTFSIANKYELEYLRLILLYDYLSSDEHNDNFINLSSITNLKLIPIDYFCEEKLMKIISLNDFHYHEYQRRFQQQKSLICFEDNQSLSNGWWQPPISSSSKQRSLANFKLQRPILF